MLLVNPVQCSFQILDPFECILIALFSEAKLFISIFVKEHQRCNERDHIFAGTANFFARFEATFTRVDESPQ